MDTIQDLYRPEDLIRLENKCKRERGIVWALAGITLALCVLFCCLTDSRSAARMELATVLCSILGGWLVIYRRTFRLKAAGHELEHAQHLLETEHSTLQGRLTVTRERLRIKNSIRIRGLLLENEEGVHRLRVNETQVPVLQRWDGQQVTLRLAGSYVAGIGGEAPDRPGPAKTDRGRGAVLFLKNIWTQLHRFVFWALISAIFWGWIFTLIDNGTPAHKVTVYVHTELCQDEALALKLEEDLPEGIRKVKVHPFSYAVFGTQDLENADVFVLPAEDLETMPESFAPLENETWDFGGRELYRMNGHDVGVKIYDAASQQGAAAAYLGYRPDTDYYLVFNAASAHLSAGDGGALRIAEALLKLD